MTSAIATGPEVTLDAVRIDAVELIEVSSCLRFLNAVFPTADLTVDANSTYGLNDARVFHALDELDPVYIEQPLAQGDLYDLVVLQCTRRTLGCLGELKHGSGDCRKVLVSDNGRVINVKGRARSWSPGGPVPSRCRSDLWRSRLVRHTGAHHRARSRPTPIDPGGLYAAGRYGVRVMVREGGRH